MHGDERELKAAGEEAEHQQHVGAMPEGFDKRLLERLRARRDGEVARTRRRQRDRSGNTSSIMPANINSVLCQANASIRPTASGENRNCPNEPAAVPAPKAIERQLSGTSLPSAPTTIGNEQPERPKPISTPAERSSVSVVVLVADPGQPVGDRPFVDARLARDAVEVVGRLLVGRQDGHAR